MVGGLVKFVGFGVCGVGVGVGGWHEEFEE